MRLASRTWEASSGRTDAPVALLLHGITGSSGTWWRVGPALADTGWRVIALDLPGHGDSPRMGRPMKVGEWAVSVRETITELLGEGSSSLDAAIGHSAGAATALELVALEPEIARRIVLEDPPGAGDQPRQDWAERLEQEVRSAKRDPDRFTRLLLRQNPTWEERDASEATDALLHCDIEAVADTERTGVGYRVAELVPSLQVPALLLLADEARSALYGEARRRVLADAPASVKVETFDTGHVIHRDAFGDYMRAVTAFLTG